MESEAERLIMQPSEFNRRYAERLVMMCPKHPLWEPLRFHFASLLWWCTVEGCQTIIPAEDLIKDVV